MKRTTNTRPNGPTKSKPVPSLAKGKGKQVDRPVKKARVASRASEDKSDGSGSGSDSHSDNGSSDDESDGEEDGEARKAAQLAALEAHSRALLGLPPLSPPSKPDDDDHVDSAEQESEEEAEDDEGEGEDFESDDGWGAEDGFVSDSEGELTAQASTTKSKPTTPPMETSNVPVVVFDQPSAASSSTLSKAERRAFLTGNSAKMMGITSTPDYPPSRKRSRQTAEEDDEDATAASLDKSLHSMLLNSLLPEHAASLASRPVDKRNAMSARLLELANYELPGEGSKVMKTQHLSKHSAKIRTGMVHKQEARDKAKRQEAIESGNNVRGMSSLGEGLKKSGGKGSQRAMMGVETGKKKGMESRKKGDEDRARGLGMGVGRFAGGMLKLTKGEIDGVNGEFERRRESSRGGRGGQGGRGGRGGGGRGGGSRGGKR
ncbi:hypothetical protein I350_00934 [Cryptococcus amylolentus CBS 6273]|uniref:Uncharacterized protein n=1 Tax=Cryptococcus amylolentus CBS 6273 TaxID=1296118 RepID=A0A1E3KB47_9TREE|nr:hypothetical protein I350_00934 [Cryptococcus amylolentus CBS 6273]